MGVQPTWLSGDRFGYRTTVGGQSQFILVDPAHATRIQCSPETDRCGGALDPREVSRLQPQAQRGPGVRAESLSPDSKRAAFIRNYNLWVRDESTGRETQLTTDGQKDFGYATDNAGWIKSDRPVVVWSPDSRKIATFQQDERAVGEMYLVNIKVGHPQLEAWKYPLPGDSVIATIQRVVINVDTPRVIRFQMPPDAHRSTLCDHVICRGTEWADLEWYPDASHVAFVSTSRDHKHEVFRVADAVTGTVRDVFREDVATQYESGNGTVNWRVLPATNEVIWFSERDNWGQLNLYDLTSGRLKSKITSGANTQFITNRQVETVDDSVGLIGSFLYSATDADNATNYSDGGFPLGGNVRFGQLTTDNYERILFSNKAGLTINAGAGSDTINLNNPNQPTGLTGDCDATTPGVQSICVAGGDPTAGDGRGSTTVCGKLWGDGRRAPRPNTTAARVTRPSLRRYRHGNRGDLVAGARRVGRPWPSSRSGGSLALEVGDMTKHVRSQRKTAPRHANSLMLHDALGREGALRQSRY